MQTNNHATFPASSSPRRLFQTFSPQTTNSPLSPLLTVGILVSCFADKIEVIRKELLQALPLPLIPTCISAPLSFASIIFPFYWLSGTQTYYHDLIFSMLKNTLLVRLIASKPPRSAKILKMVLSLLTTFNFSFTTLD